jgi:phosphoglycerate dehydrogenase-like enzyme
VLIYGYGSIGQQLAKRLHAFDVNSVSAVTRTLPADGSVPPGQNYLSELCPTTEYPRLAASADIVFVCCTQNAATVGLVNKEFISYLKAGAVIVNVARVSWSYFIRSTLY